MTECRRCGICCLAGLALIHDEDTRRWEREGREDILHVVDSFHPRWAGDHLIASDGGMVAHGCPFLEREGDHTRCSIYETRPLVCRNFMPGSSGICPLWKG